MPCLHARGSRVNSVQLEDPLFHSLLQPSFLGHQINAISRGEIDFERLIAYLLHQMIVNSHAWRSPGAMRGLSFNDRLIINGLIHPPERTNLWCSQVSTRLVACLRRLGVMLVEKDVVYCQRHFFSICRA